MDDTAESRRRSRMATPQKEPVRAVTPAEQAALERLARSSSERVDRVRRATAVWAVVQGQGFAAAARQAGFGSSTTVAKLVARFNRRGLAAVSIAAGRGRKPTYDPPARARIVATAQRPAARRNHHPARAGGRGQFVPEDADLVPDGDRGAQAQKRHRARDGSTDRTKKGMIELAYGGAEAAGVPVWCQDEAGPYQAIPQPGAGWQPVGAPRRQPH